MKPSTMPRARSSRLSSREKKTGSASWRGSKDKAGFGVQSSVFQRIGRHLFGPPAKVVFAFRAAGRAAVAGPERFVTVLDLHGQVAEAGEGDLVGRLVRYQVGIDQQ